MRNRAVWVLMGAALAGCAVAPPPAQQVASQGPNCIALDRVVGRRAVAPNAVEFDLIGGTRVRNQLATVCPGIERLGDLAAIAITSPTHSGQLCSGDRVRIFDPVEARATGLQSYPECVLGDFTEFPRP